MSMIDGEPWFVAKDVVLCLGLDPEQINNHTRNMGDDERRRVVRKDHTPSMAHVFTFRVASLTFISESGLYKLVMRSDKPEAKAFQDWVTREVLPSIRKTGSYSAGEPVQATAPVPETFHRTCLRPPNRICGPRRSPRWG